MFIQINDKDTDQPIILSVMHIISVSKKDDGHAIITLSDESCLDNISTTFDELALSLRPIITTLSLT